MANLIITMICISLAVVVASMGAVYVNPMIFKAKEYQHQAEAGFVKLKVAYDLYVLYKGEKPDPDDDWKAKLNATSGASISGDAVPKDVQGGYTWDYDKVGVNRYFCLSGADYNKAAMKGFKHAQESLKSDRVFINATCGATTDDTSITSGSLAITYWIYN